MAAGLMTKLEAKRQINFLATFDRKFDGFRREIERVKRAVETGTTYGGRWPLDGLERIAKSLVGAGAVYGLLDITDWAKKYLQRLADIREQSAHPTHKELDWQEAKIAVLE